MESGGLPLPLFPASFRGVLEDRAFARVRHLYDLAGLCPLLIPISAFAERAAAKSALYSSLCSLPLILPSPFLSGRRARPDLPYSLYSSFPVPRLLTNRTFSGNLLHSRLLIAGKKRPVYPAVFAFSLG